ncbi:MAG: hypothetical protein GY849_00715 [Deltaproteobacteria bacterium]|nr:hypothetical protein [Deltaproteobacteria bacterium]
MKEEEKARLELEKIISNPDCLSIDILSHIKDKNITFCSQIQSINEFRFGEKNILKYDETKTYFKGDECIANNRYYIFQPNSRQKQTSINQNPEKLEYGWDYS